MPVTSFSAVPEVSAIYEAALLWPRSRQTSE
jgi:hypothetical protein